MKVGLIDIASGGHHVPYAMEISKAVREAGHVPYVIGPPEWCRCLGDGAQTSMVEWKGSSGSYIFQRASRARFIASALDACRSARVDVAHFLYVDGFTDLFPIAAGNDALSLLMTLHWYPFLNLSIRQPKQAMKAAQVVYGLRRLRTAATHTIVHSERARERLRAVGVTRVHAVDYPSNISVASRGANDSVAARAALGLPPDRKLVLCFGGTRYDKGADLAVRAMAETSADTLLVIAGAEQDFDRSQLMRLANEHGVSDRICLRLGHVPDEEVIDLFNAVDVLLLPYRSVFKGQSGPLVIAGSLGVPVVAANVPVLGETITRYGLGRLFPPGDVAALALNLNQHLPRLNKIAQMRFAQAASPDAFGQRMVRIYEQVRRDRNVSIEFTPRASDDA